MQKINAGCLCGDITFEVTNDFEELFFCNCDQCRKITASAFASNLFVNKQNFTWTSSTDGVATFQVPGRNISKSFCKRCGSGVPWASSDGTKMVVPAGLLADEPNISEKFRIFTAEQPEWSKHIDGVTAHQNFPD